MSENTHYQKLLTATLTRSHQKAPLIFRRMVNGSCLQATILEMVLAILIYIFLTIRQWVGVSDFLPSALSGRSPLIAGHERASTTAPATVTAAAVPTVASHFGRAVAGAVERSGEGEREGSGAADACAGAAAALACGTDMLTTSRSYPSMTRVSPA